MPAATPLPQGVHRLLPLYNPQRGARLRLSIQTSGLDEARVRCYSPAMVLVQDLELGPLSQGWHQASMDARSLAPGLYWLRLSSQGNELGKPIRVVLLPN